MPITETLYNADGSKTVTDTYLGRVLKVEQRVVRMNWSDTLDYTDFRDTDAQFALVWEGRTWRGQFGFDNEESERPVRQRFTWHNCRSLFTDRGQPARHAKVDVIALAIPELVEDLEEWTRAMEQDAREAEARRLADEKARQEREAEAEKHRPIRGKRMVVVSGRKVRVGTVGTVAYIHDNGGVLLKDDDKWQDRKAQGTWVSPQHLRAR